MCDISKALRIVERKREDGNNGVPGSAAEATHRSARHGMAGSNTESVETSCAERYIEINSKGGREGLVADTSSTSSSQSGPAYIGDTSPSCHRRQITAGVNSPTTWKKPKRLRAGSNGTGKTEAGI